MSDFKTDVSRVMMMLFNICGCSNEKALKVLEECKTLINDKTINWENRTKNKYGGIK